MRGFATIATLSVLAAAPGAAQAQACAIVAAFPDRFSFVYEPPQRERNGAVRVDRDRRESADAPEGTFNRIALAGLEKAMAARDPDCPRVPLSVRSPLPEGLGSADREDYLIGRVTSELEKMPGRRGWKRIVVATPAFRAQPLDGMPGRIEGFGVFLQPNCQSNPRSCGMGFRPAMGPEASTPSGEKSPANFFIAPYSYVAVWTLDPETLAVLDRQATYDHRKMFDPLSGTLDLGVNIPRDVLATKIVDGIESSILNALAQGEAIGKVKVHDVREVKPDARAK